MGCCLRSWRQWIAPQWRRACGADPERLYPGTTKLQLSPTTGMMQMVLPAASLALHSDPAGVHSPSSVLQTGLAARRGF